MWTEFIDMHSGGRCKIPPYEHIYIEATMGEAIAYFESRFDQHPSDIACDCCGENFSVDEMESLDSIAHVWRGCRSVDEFLASDDVLVITSSEMKSTD